ncbi:NACHT and WD repeat domain-containing protein 2-like [Lytechinus variegatus]|uniref:NACHT and WD repeat domain-containing protein 2-like n=1 Tax=Lytechinus variegatus TaxID=7654 RepID=UPI001BB26B31|nr:NACHT and WD repeat domain-containing protein 2-like [Lytechinus variegatus]
MGTAGSIPALQNRQEGGYPKRSKAWMGLKATIRFKLLNNGLWSSMRSEREPWRGILHNAAADFDQEQDKLQDAVVDLESTQMFRDMVRGMVPPPGMDSGGRSVWVFISSTFTDTRIERDLLLMDAYPYIRDYCRQIGIDFNVVDFRWGIRQGASNRHMAADICYNEVARCRDNSIGPYFVAILGNKYGYRPIPPKFTMTTYQKVVAYLEKEETSESLEAVALMKEWYILDTNALKESEYVLQPIDSKLKNYYSFDEALAQVDRDQWNKVFSVLQQGIYSAVKYIPDMDPEYVKDVIQSVTEGEIEVGLEGIGSRDSGGPPRCYTFTRSINGLDSAERFSRRFLDSGSPLEQVEKQRKLGELKEKLSKTLPPDALYNYALRFHPSQEEMMKDDGNKDTLKSFVDMFCHFMVNSIKSYAITALQNMDNYLFTEVMHHSSFCRDRAATVIGQEDNLERLMGYLSSETNKDNKPFVIHGLGGTGKTALIAKLFSMSIEKHKGDVRNRPHHIVRFIGITPQSYDIRNLLYSICEQICHCLGIDDCLIPKDYKKLQNAFLILLQKSSKNHPIMIFLDSLDQLSDEYQGRDLLWLPRQLPPHVRLVVTVRPDAGFCLTAIKNLINKSEYFLEIKSLAEPSKLPMLECLLANNGRTLTKDQMKIVLKAHKDNKPTALYMKIACDMASNWNSHTPLKTCRIAGDITGIITQLFEQLEEKHGMLFVAHALGYLTCSRSGLTSNELLDILSCDDPVLEDVFEHSTPPIRKLPPLLWTRLRLDLGSNLVESGADNMVVYRWYHRIFYEVAYTRYVQTNMQQLHQSIAEYFSERWARTPKPYVNKKTKKVDVAFRQVQTQPLVLDQGLQEQRGGSASSIRNEFKKTAGPRYNMRKLTELPFHLIRAKMWDEVEKVMCSIPWIEAKCQTGRIYQLILELAQAADQLDHKSQKVTDFYYMIRANAQIIQENPELITQQALNEPDSSACCQVAAEYLKSTCKKKLCWQALSKSQVQSAEVMTLTHTAPVFLVQFSPKGNLLATACTDNTVRIWIVASGALEATIETAALKAVFPPSANWVAILGSKSICTYGIGDLSLSKGKLLKRIHVSKVEPVNGTIFVPSNSKHLYFYSYSILTIYNAVSGKEIQRSDVSPRPKCVAFSPDGKLMGIGNRGVFLWDIFGKKVLKTFCDSMLCVQSSLRFSKDGKTLCGVLKDGTYCWPVKGIGTKPTDVLNLNCLGGVGVVSPNLDFGFSLMEDDTVEILKMKAKEWCKLSGHKGPVKCANFCQPNSQYGFLATGSDDHTVRIWDTNHITKFTQSAPKVKQVHSGPVSACIFFPDGSKAVTSCKGEDCILWDLNQSVPQAYAVLGTPVGCVMEKVQCVSDDGCFVFATCNGSDFDIWNLKSAPRRADKVAIISRHRLLPFVGPRYLFVKCKSHAIACFTTDNKPGDIFVYDLLSASCIGDWMAYPDEMPLFDDYTMCVKTLHHGHDFYIAAAALSDDQRSLATVAIRTSSSDNSLKPIPEAKAQAYLTNPPVVRIWHISKGTPMMEVDMKVTMTRFHKIRYLADQLIVFMHMKWRDRLNERGRSSSKSARSKRYEEEEHKQGEVMVSVLDSSSGYALYTEKRPGMYTKMSVPKAQFLNTKRTAKENAQRTFLSCVKDGILITRRVGDNQPVGKFRQKDDDVTAYAFSADNSRTLVGVDDGTVHLLRIVGDS